MCMFCSKSGFQWKNLLYIRWAWSFSNTSNHALQLAWAWDTVNTIQSHQRASRCCDTSQFIQDNEDSYLFVDRLPGSAIGRHDLSRYISMLDFEHFQQNTLRLLSCPMSF
jgi:hypothetical protein